MTSYAYPAYQILDSIVYYINTTDGFSLCQQLYCHKKTFLQSRIMMLINLLL